MKTIFFLVLSTLFYSYYSQAAEVGECKNAKIPNVIKVVVPAGVGNSSDTLARTMNEEIKKQFKEIGIETNIIVENKDGASGNIGMAAAKNSGKTDGSTILFTQSPELIVNPRLKEPVASHTADDFTPISFVASNPYVLVCNKKRLPHVKTIADLVKHIKSGKGIQYGNGGLSNFTNITMLEFSKSTGIPIGDSTLQTVPYKSTSASFQDVVGGQVDCMFQSYPSVASTLSQADSPIVALGTTMAAGEKRKPLDQVPAIADEVSGYHKMLNWTGYLAPKGTNSDFVNCFNQQVQRSLASAEIQKQLEARGFVKTASDPVKPSDFKKFVDHGVESMTGFVSIINGDKPGIAAPTAPTTTRTKN